MNNGIKDVNVKLFLLQTSPILRFPLSYIDMKDPNSAFYDPRLEELTFEEYLENDTLFETNEVTKRILCSQNDEITRSSLERAKYILKSSATGVFNDHYDSFIQFKRAFHHWKFLSSPIVDKCVKAKFNEESNQMNNRFEKYGVQFSGYQDKMRGTNEFDMELYAFTALGRTSKILI